MIVYSLVARGTIVLAEYTGSSGNFPVITRVLLGKISTLEPVKMSYIYDQYIFHYIVEDSIIYLCLCDENSSNRRRIPFAFLEEMKKRFTFSYGNRAATAIAYSMSQEFGRTMQSLMDHYNGPSADSLSDVNSKIDEVKNVMVRNIEMVLERGEKLEILVDKADRLNAEAFRFEGQSRKLKNAMWWRRLKFYLIIFIVIMVIIGIIVAVGCSYTGCSSGSK